MDDLHYSRKLYVLCFSKRNLVSAGSFSVRISRSDQPQTCFDTGSVDELSDVIFIWIVLAIGGLTVFHVEWWKMLFFFLIGCGVECAVEQSVMIIYIRMISFRKIDKRDLLRNESVFDCIYVDDRTLF